MKTKIFFVILLSVFSFCSIHGQGRYNYPLHHIDFDVDPIKALGPSTCVVTHQLYNDGVDKVHVSVPIESIDGDPYILGIDGFVGPDYIWLNQITLEVPESDKMLQEIIKFDDLSKWDVGDAWHYVNLEGKPEYFMTVFVITSVLRSYSSYRALQKLVALRLVNGDVIEGEDDGWCFSTKLDDYYDVRLKTMSDQMYQKFFEK